MPMSEPQFSALKHGNITLHLINADNATAVRAMVDGFPDSPYMLAEFDQSCQPEYKEGRRSLYGFYATLDGVLAGMSLLGISSWSNLRGFTGADTFVHMRGRGVAPGSKPHLFYLGFHLLGLHRIETGCLVSNTSSKRSIEKTAGFQFEGILRGYSRNERGEFEDEYRWSILRPEWEQLYDPAAVEVIS